MRANGMEGTAELTLVSAFLHGSPSDVHGYHRPANACGGCRDGASPDGDDAVKTTDDPSVLEKVTVTVLGSGLTSGGVLADRLIPLLVLAYFEFGVRGCKHSR